MSTEASNVQRPTSNAQKTDWRRVAARMRAALDRAATTEVRHTNKAGDVWWTTEKLAGRPKELAELVVKATVARGRWRVKLPTLEAMGSQIGIGPNHVRGVFHVLESARLVELKRAEAGWDLVVFPHSGDWRVAWRYEEEALLAYLAALDQAPGQVQGEMFPEEEVETTARAAFSRAEAEASTAKAAEFPKREVPKTGSAVNGLTLQSSRLSPSSQLSEEAVKPGKQLNSEPQARGKAFTPTERELLDRLRAALGDEDVRQWGGYWVKHFIRPMPHALGVALDELHARKQEGVNIARPAHWLQATARHVDRAMVVHLGNDQAQARRTGGVNCK